MGFCWICFLLLFYIEVTFGNLYLTKKVIYENMQKQKLMQMNKSTIGIKTYAVFQQLLQSNEAWWRALSFKFKVVHSGGSDVMLYFYLFRQKKS